MGTPALTQHATVIVNGEAFYLTNERDIPALQQDVVDAARAGGDLIDVSPNGDKTRCVLVTPASNVKFALDEVEASVDPQDHGSRTWVYDEFE